MDQLLLIRRMFLTIYAAPFVGISTETRQSEQLGVKLKDDFAPTSPILFIHVELPILTRASLCSLVLLFLKLSLWRFFASQSLHQSRSTFALGAGLFGPILET